MTIPLGYGQATILWRGDNLPSGAANVFGFQNVGGVSAYSAAQTIYNAWQARILPQLTTATQMEACRVKLGPDATGPMDTYDEVQGGAIASSPEVASVSILVRKMTNVGGRAGRGRFYVPGASEDEVTGAGLLDPPRRGFLQTAFDGLLTDLDSAGLPMVVLHDPDKNGQLPGPTPVTYLSVDATVATQRRRLRR